MTTTATSIDEQVRRYLDLTEKIEQLTADRDAVKAELRAAGIGKHATSYGITVSVSANRRLDVEAAWNALTPEQQQLCLSPDAKKIKGQLAPDVAEAFMAEVGEPRVVVK